ncbi:CDP-glycerol glycerophosphotransferase [Bacilli bacterium PM5-3]|nr:CDP-glycerol glycerophosphotransferase [Bacilli bacterium PM5-3]
MIQFFKIFIRKTQSFLKIQLSKILYKTSTPDDKTILFSSYMGKFYGCSPRQIYEYMISDPYFDDYTFIWSFKYPEQLSNSVLKTLERSKIVLYNSKEHIKAYYQAKYWVNNSRTPIHIKKRDDQFYIQTWHGIPYKKIGFDIKLDGDNGRYEKEQLNKLYLVDAKKYDFMPSNSDYYSKVMTSAFNLKAINKENIIVKTGLPRNDFLFNYSKKDIELVKSILNLNTNKKIILYAPTWRDNEYVKEQGYISSYDVDFDYLQKHLSDKYIIIFRPHYFISNEFDYKKYEGFIYNGNLIQDINYLYIISDILITDYSSVFFDFSLLNRKISFFMYDYEFYKNTLRGFYLEDNQLPGNISRTEKELVNDILNEDKSSEKMLKKFAEEFNKIDDGNSSKRVVDEIFKQKK